MFSNQKVGLKLVVDNNVKTICSPPSLLIPADCDHLCWMTQSKHNGHLLSSLYYGRKPVQDRDDMGKKRYPLETHYN